MAGRARPALEHAKDDCADKGERDVGGNNAQSADERTHEGHRGKLPGSHRLPTELSRLANRSGRKKSALLSLAVAAAGDVVKE